MCYNAIAYTGLLIIKVFFLIGFCHRDQRAGRRLPANMGASCQVTLDVSSQRFLLKPVRVAKRTFLGRGFLFLILHCIC